MSNKVTQAGSPPCWRALRSTRGCRPHTAPGAHLDDLGAAPTLVVVNETIARQVGISILNKGQVGEKHPHLR